MWSQHLKRQLTPAEEKLFTEHRCIVCGQTVNPLGTNHKNGKVYYPTECQACSGMGRRASPGRYWGAGGASLGSEYRRTMGYGSRTGAAPDFDSADADVKASKRSS